MRMVDSKIRNTVIHIIASEEVATLYLWYCRLSECLIEKIGPVLHVYFIRFDVIERGHPSQEKPQNDGWTTQRPETQITVIHTITSHPTQGEYIVLVVNLLCI